MAPSQQVNPIYQKNEKALCFHGQLMYHCRILDVRPTDGTPAASSPVFEFRVHYERWKSKWDSWVTQDRLRKLTPENLAEKERLDSQLNPPKSARSSTKVHNASRKSASGLEGSSVAGSEDRPPLSTTARAQKRARDMGLESEQTFMGKRCISIPIPDHLKAILVDDWEFITKDQKLVPLPSSTSVRTILHDYLEQEKQRRSKGSANYDLAQEIHDGLIDYFEKALGKFLLYKSERAQYSDILRTLGGEDESWTSKTISDVYGAEHLARTLTTLPLDIAESNLDKQSVDALQEELKYFAKWLTQHSDAYFVNAYENASTQHVEILRHATIPSHSSSE